jgi:hypothetical protein
VDQLSPDLAHRDDLGAPPTAIGISAEHPYDEQILSHRDVVFVEDFENANWAAKWGENSRPHCRTRATSADRVQNGDHSLELRIETEGECGGNGAAGWMTYWPDNGNTGYDETYVRYYYRVSAGGNWSNNKLVQLHGHRLGVKYGTGAGVRPDGTYYAVGTGIGGDDGPPWNVGILYTYHLNQPGNYGENFQPNQGNDPPILEDQWYCKEFMVKTNDLGMANGEQRMWLDDVLIVETTDLELRVNEEIKTNMLMQPAYTSQPGDRTLWLDSIVMATSRIGCMHRP